MFCANVSGAPRAIRAAALKTSLPIFIFSSVSWCSFQVSAPDCVVEALHSVKHRNAQKVARDAFFLWLAWRTERLVRAGGPRRARASPDRIGGDVSPKTCTKGQV